MMAFDMSSLITDRTAADVQRVAYLEERIADGSSTPAELAEYVAGMKGAYTAGDLNRVGEAVNYVAQLLTAAGYPYSPQMKTNWTDADYFYPANMPPYLAAVEGLRQSFVAWADTPAIPDDVKDYQQANDVEQIIADVYQAYENMVAAYYFLGDLYLGEV